MTALIHKTTSIALAFLLIFSTLSFTIEKHFCGDVLVDISVFTEAQKCAMEAFEMEMASDTKENCCKDEVNVFHGQTELQTSSFDELKFQQQVFLQAFAVSYVNLFQDLPKKSIPHKDYSPPNIVQDIQVLNEVFLI